MTRSRAAAMIAAAIFVLGLGWFAAAALNENSLAGGDPSGALTRALRAEALELGRVGSITSDITRPPTRDSCDGREGTEGWTKATALLTVSASPANVETVARARGWHETRRSAAPYETTWEHRVAGRRATLLLLTDLAGPNSTRVVVEAQPEGPIPSGC